MTESAFPSLPINPGNQPIHTGMSLRDYFAAKAMQELLMPAMGTVTGRTTPAAAIEVAAESAYEVADAMMKARLSHG